MTRPCDMLPPVRGTLVREAPLKELVWFRAGGPADVLFRPADVEDLAGFLAARPAGLCVQVIGVGSNLLIRDGGFPGAVLRLPASFGKIETNGTRLRAGAAALDANVAKAAADAGIAGMEFLRGVPGTVGGALRMNAGCYGREIADIFVEATALEGAGNKVTLSKADMGFVYRHTAAPEDLIFVEAVFEGTRDAPDAIKARMEELVASREASQPIRAKTGGSTFKNPPGQKAWQLIDKAGCRGLRRGMAQVSEKHCNFLINIGDATAADIEALGEDVRRRVWESQGVALEWEIKRVGLPLSAEVTP
ncbi:MAG TPA: UDP-N-acetylmuramate dehydrogenase [Rhizomicrobium sp.]|nr:UDP-N-acetylmuramate dehydrogenase [Rhizomicrobium sp.]